MKPLFLSLTLTVGLALPASANYYFLVSDAETATLRLVFSARPKVDAATSLESLLAGGNTAFTQVGQTTALKLEKGGDGFLLVTADGQAPRGVVRGTVEGGVVMRGQPAPARVVHGVEFTPGEATTPTGKGLEVTASPTAEGVRFRVTLDGQPLSTDVSVDRTGEKRPQATRSDAEGYTPTFPAAGTVSARCLAVEAKPGEHQGRAYQSVRRYASCVFQAKP